MPWTAGVFARLYGATGWVADRDAATGILATRADSHDQDLADGINACLKKDGTNTATANLALGTFRLTGIGDPINPQDAATKVWVESAAQLVFATGDQILWRGASTPTGWTVAAQNNKALRIVSGVPTSGGTNSFTAAFNSNRNTAVEAAHTHTGSTSTVSNGEFANATVASGSSFALANHIHTFFTSAGSGHLHAFNLDVQYYDMQIIQKT